MLKPNLPLTNFPFPYFIDLVLVVSMIWISWVEKIEFYIPSFIQSNSFLKLQSYKHWHKHYAQEKTFLCTHHFWQQSQQSCQQCLFTVKATVHTYKANSNCDHKLMVVTQATQLKILYRYLLKILIV